MCVTECRAATEEVVYMTVTFNVHVLTQYAYMHNDCVTFGEVDHVLTRFSVYV